MIVQVIKAAREHGGAAVPVKDTIKAKVMEASFAESTPPQGQAQSNSDPPAFRCELLIEAHLKAQVRITKVPMTVSWWKN